MTREENIRSIVEALYDFDTNNTKSLERVATVILDAIEDRGGPASAGQAQKSCGCGLYET